MDVDEHVAREREHRDGIGRRVGAKQHHRVRARGRPACLVRPVVVPDHERDRCPPGKRRRELFLGLLDAGRVRRERGHALVQPQVHARDHPEDDDSHEHGDPEQNAADDPSSRPRRLVGLAVPRHRGQRGRRQDGMPVPVEAAPSPDSSLQRRSQTGSSRNETRPERGAASSRIPDAPAGVCAYLVTIGRGRRRAR